MIGRRSAEMLTKLAHENSRRAPEKNLGVKRVARA
jgi:hypothetical protein